MTLSLFPVLHQTAPQWVLCGIIWSVALGFAAGNYACSLVHRLPRGRSILEHKPYCGECRAPLQTKDLFPVISAVLLKHRCRYCGVKFPTSHTWTELLIGLLFALCYLQFGFGEQYFLVAGAGVFLVTLAAIHANENRLMPVVLICALVFGMLNRTLADGEIYNFFLGGLAGVFVGMALAHKQVTRVNHIYNFPVPAQLVAAGGVLAGLNRFPHFLAAFAIAYAFFWLLAKLLRRSNFALSVPFGFAVTVLLLVVPSHG